MNTTKKLTRTEIDVAQHHGAFRSSQDWVFSIQYRDGTGPFNFASRLQTSSVDVPQWDLLSLVTSWAPVCIEVERQPIIPDVLAMFRLQYSSERATQPLVDDAS